MEPRIQYATTSDGVNIAFYSLGEGTPPLVSLGAMPVSNVDLEWRYPEYRDENELFAQSRQFVRFDLRGSGMSTRDVSDYSVEAFLRDLEAVVDRLHLERFALLGYVSSARLAVVYAAQRPARVSHLVLVEPYVRGSDALEASQAKVFSALLNADWEMYTETLASVAFGWAAGDPARRFAEFVRECVTREAYKAFFHVDRGLDVGDALAQVRAPALVLHRRQVPFPTIESAKMVASMLGDARLTVLEGTWMGATDAIVSAVNEFLDEGEEPAPTDVPSGLVTILFTDMQSSTALRRKLGDAQVQELVRAHNEIVRAALGEHAGREITHTGDGIMASFSTATSALRCGIDIQRGVAAHKEAHTDSPLGVYVGLNAGEPIAEDDPDGRVDLFGTSVDLARRVCDHAEPGQILASNVVRELAEGKDFLFSDIGDVVPKGFEEPVRLYEVRWEED